MKVYTLLVFNSDGKLIEEESFDYNGPVALCKGASAAETDAQKTTADFQKAIINMANTTFPEQQSIIRSIVNAWAPVLGGGPGQFGFTPEETSAMFSQATEGTASEYAKAKIAANEQAAVKGGDVPIAALSGTNAQIGSAINTAAAESQASKKLNIIKSGYDLGYQKYLAATQAMSGAASLENPVGYLSPANQAGANAFNMAHTINQENQAASPWNFIAPILGGAAGAFLGPVGSMLGSKLGSAIAGGGGGGGTTNAGPGGSFPGAWDEGGVGE